MGSGLESIEEKVKRGERLTVDEGIELYELGDLGFLGRLASLVRHRINGDAVFFNRNFHIEPTNICIHNCLFCSYRKRVHEPEAWEMQHQEIIEQIIKFKDKGVTEVHIVGGVHPQRDLQYYARLLKDIKTENRALQIKAFTAVELDYMVKKSKLSITDGLKMLKEAGLDSIPGGGAEIFDATLRQKICPDKADADRWLNIHETAHNLGIPSNATMLYGHLEHYSHRIDYLDRLRKLQDQTGGFQAFIPLKYRNRNNELSSIGEVTGVEDLKNYAVSRIYLDNIPHLKAYWPMIGKEMASLSLDFGVDDLDGTIDDTTKIYSMAGVADQKPVFNTQDLVNLIRSAKRSPVERDTLYNTLKTY